MRRTFTGALAATACATALALTPAGAAAAGSCEGTATPTAAGAKVSVTCDFGTRSFQLLSSAEITGATGFAGFDCSAHPVDQPGSPYSSQLSCRLPRARPGEGPITHVRPGEPIAGTVTLAGGPRCDGADPVKLSFYTTSALDEELYEGEVDFDVCAASGDGDAGKDDGAGEPPAAPARGSATIAAGASSALVRVTCKTERTCKRLRVVLRTRRAKGKRAVVLGKATVSVRAGKTQRVRVKFTRAGKRALKRARSGKLRAVLAVERGKQRAERDVVLKRRR